VGDIRSLLRVRCGDKVRVLPIPVGRGGWLRRRMGFGGRGGDASLSIIDRVVAAIEERLLWSRFGL
jgi:hypothetical protein